VTRFASGVSIFILGFAKKILLANPADTSPTRCSTPQIRCPGRLGGVLAYAFQIYFDFCGYSDMAVGLGRMLGFEFLKNFDAPYRSESITDLCGGGISRCRACCGLPVFSAGRQPERGNADLRQPGGGDAPGRPVAWREVDLRSVGGLSWSPAGWERWRGKQSLYRAWPRSLRIALTFVLMLFSWVWFRADTLSEAMSYFGSMFGLAPVASAAPSWRRTSTRLTGCWSWGSVRGWCSSRSRRMTGRNGPRRGAAPPS